MCDTSEAQQSILFEVVSAGMRSLLNLSESEFYSAKLSTGKLFTLTWEVLTSMLPSTSFNVVRERLCGKSAGDCDYRELVGEDSNICLFKLADCKLLGRVPSSQAPSLEERVESIFRATATRKTCVRYCADEIEVLSIVDLLPICLVVGGGGINRFGGTTSYDHIMDYIEKGVVTIPV